MGKLKNPDDDSEWMKELQQSDWYKELESATQEERIEILDGMLENLEDIEELEKEKEVLDPLSSNRGWKTILRWIIATPLSLLGYSIGVAAVGYFCKEMLVYDHIESKIISVDWWQLDVLVAILVALIFTAVYSGACVLIYPKPQMGQWINAIFLSLFCTLLCTGDFIYAWMDYSESWLTISGAAATTLSVMGVSFYFVAQQKETEAS